MNSSNDNGSAAANPTPSLSELADVPTMDSIDIKIFAEKIDKP